MNDTIPELVLSDGLKLPAIGLGTYKLNGHEGVEAIKTAVSIGYRLIDSAFSRSPA